MEINCPHCGKSVVVNGLGRKKGNYSVKIVLDTYRVCGSVRATARKVDMPPGTVWHILNDNGALNKHP